METLFADWSDERLQREWDRDDKSDLAWTVALADELHRRGFPVAEPHRDGVAAVASVSAGAHQPEGARRGGKEAAEVACADRDEGVSEAQAAEEDLARQVETRHACPAALRGGRVLGGKHLKMLQDARTKRWARSHSGGDRAPQKRSGRLRSGEAACRSSTRKRQRSRRRCSSTRGPRPSRTRLTRRSGGPRHPPPPKPRNLNPPAGPCF